MERKKAIRSAYRLTGGNNFYDGMITCSTLSGKAVCRLVWDMNKAENADKLPSIAAPVPCVLCAAQDPVPENAPKQIRLYRQKHCTKPKIADISSKISVSSCCLDRCMVLYLTCSFCIESTILKQKGSFSCQM